MTFDPRSEDRLMKTTHAPFRLFVVLLFVFGLMVPVASTAAAAAQGTVTCDDFTTEAEAQDALDDDPDLADALDEDGNGVACDETSNGVSLDDIRLPDETDDATEEGTEEATAEDEVTPEDDTPSVDADGEEYLATVQDEVDGLSDSIEAFNSLIESVQEAPEADRADIVDEFNAIAEDWSVYPADVAAEITAPDGFEDIDDAYQDLAAEVGEMGDNWLEFWSAERDSTEEQDAQDAFSENYDNVLIQIEELNILLEEAAGETATEGATPAATEEGSDDDGDAYVATVQAEVDGLSDSLTEFEDLIAVAGDDGASNTEKQDAIDEFNAIAEDWSAYPDIAAEITAPDGFEDIDDAYQDLAAEVGEMGDNWQAFWTAEQDSSEEQEAQDAFSESLDNVETGIEDLNTLLEGAAGGGTPTEEATEEATEDVDADADEYLTTVRENTDELADSLDRFNEIANTDGEFTDEELAEIGDILDLWADASDAAAELDAPTEFSEIQETYEDLAAELGDAADNFLTFGDTEPDSPEADEALEAFFTNLETADTLIGDLDDLLTDAGY